MEKVDGDEIALKRVPQEILNKMNIANVSQEEPEHAEMVIAICLDKMAIKDYAQEINDKSKNVYERFRYVKKLLRKKF